MGCLTPLLTALAYCMQNQMGLGDGCSREEQAEPLGNGGSSGQGWGRVFTLWGCPHTLKTRP